MKKLYISVIFITICNLALSQEYWYAKAIHNSDDLIQTKGYSLDLLTFRKKIQSNHKIEIPNLNGILESYEITENSNFSPELSKKYPNIKSYIGFSKNGELRLSVSPDKIEGLILENNGKINTLEKVNNLYNTYEIKPKSSSSKLNCLTKNDKTVLNSILSENKKTDRKLRTYRIAISATGEYTKYYGGTKEKALAAINASLTRVNAILEREVAVHLNLVANNDKIIFTDAEKDPYSNSERGAGDYLWSTELQETLTKIIGEDNYDLGHLLSAEGEGGYSGGIGTVCENGQKGKGFSSPYDNKPEGASFDIDYLTHEIGHQLGATHIFSNNEGTGTNVEPGSGSTIMGYAGIVDINNGIYNVQKNSDGYFNQVSIFQINSTLKNKNCGIVTSLPNTPPNVETKKSYIIPAKTPFTLKGTANGEHKENFTYAWEQLDSSETDNYSLSNPESTTGPLFRSFTPTKTPERTFPEWNKLLKHDLYSKFDALPKVSRELNFGLIARDGNSTGQSTANRVNVKVIDSKTGFSIIQPKEFQSINSGEQLDIKWNVTDTDKAPINVSKVNIYLTEDGINKTLLKEKTDNDGSETVTIPKDYSAKQAYIQVEAVDNIFFALSNRVSIGYIGDNVCKSYKSIDKLPIAIPDGLSTTRQKYGDPVRVNFSVEEAGNINSVSLNLNLEHPHSSDLFIYLQSPNGETVSLFNHNCNKDKFNDLITDKAESLNCSNLSQKEFSPAESFSKLNNTNQKGIWSLFAKDRDKLDEGKIIDATLNVCSTNYRRIDNIPANKDKVRIYPNPISSSDKLNVDILKLEKPGVSFKIYNLVGQLITQQENLISTNPFTQKISLSGINEGVYILKVEGHGIDFSTKLIIQ